MHSKIYIRKIEKIRVRQADYTFKSKENMVLKTGGVVRSASPSIIFAKFNALSKALNSFNVYSMTEMIVNSLITLFNMLIVRYGLLTSFERPRRYRQALGHHRRHHRQGLLLPCPCFQEPPSRKSIAEVQLA